MIEKIRTEGFQTRNDLNYFLTGLKDKEGWLYQYHSKMLQMISTQAASAQESLIANNKKGCKIGMLRFARYNDFRTLTYNSPDSK
jgi:putative transposase